MTGKFLLTDKGPVLAANYSPLSPFEPQNGAPPGVEALLHTHGIDTLPGWKLTVAQVDAHMAKRGASIDARMAVKSCLAQIGRL
jgi:hypothetical protein